VLCPFADGIAGIFHKYLFIVWDFFFNLFSSSLFFLLVKVVAVLEVHSFFFTSFMVVTIPVQNGFERSPLLFDMSSIRFIL